MQHVDKKPEGGIQHKCTPVLFCLQKTKNYDESYSFLATYLQYITMSYRTCVKT